MSKRARVTRDVEHSTVDTMTKRVLDSSKGALTVEQAKKVATDSAERVNRRRQEGK